MLYFDTTLSLADPFPIEVIFQKLIRAALGADHARAMVQSRIVSYNRETEPFYFQTGKSGFNIFLSTLP